MTCCAGTVCLCVSRELWRESQYSDIFLSWTWKANAEKAQVSYNTCCFFFFFFFFLSTGLCNLFWEVALGYLGSLSVWEKLCWFSWASLSLTCTSKAQVYLHPRLQNVMLGTDNVLLLLERLAMCNTCRWEWWFCLTCLPMYTVAFPESSSLMSRTVECPVLHKNYILHFSKVLSHSRFLVSCLKEARLYSNF